MGSKGSGSEDEPLVPDDFDDEFFRNLTDKMPEITKALRQKDTHDNADNVQRLLICCNRYKSDLHMEQLHTQELNDEITVLQERLESAAKLSSLDQSTIEELRTVIEGAWEQKDAAQMREQIAQDEVLRLREKVEALEDTVQQLSDKRIGLQKRDENKERETLKKEIRDLNKRLQVQRTYTSEVEAMTQTQEEKNKELLKLLDETSTEAYNMRKRLDLLQKDLNHMKSEELKHAELITQLKARNAHLIKLKVRQNLQVLSLKTNLEQVNSQHNAASNKLAKITVELEYVVQERDSLKQSLLQRINVLKIREEELMKMRHENSNLSKSQDNAARKYASLDGAKRDAEEENLRLKTQMNTQDKELESMRRVVHHFEKNCENLTKERDILKRDLFLEQRTAGENEALFQEAQHDIRSLKDAIHITDMKFKKLQDDYGKVKMEKAKKVNEIQTWVDKLEALQNDIHLKENYEIELKRTITDIEQKCARFQSQHDNLTSEKTNLQRSLQTAEEEKCKVKEQVISLQNSIEELKVKVSYRDGELSKLQLQIDRMEKERRLLKADIRNAQLAQQHTRSDLQEKRKENDRFSKSRQEDEQKLSRLQKNLDNALHEKNSICAALNKRHEEYAQLKDNLDNLQTVYDQTEKQFAQSQDDMRLMRTEIKNLRTERDVLRKDRENAADLRQELLQMHRLLNQERIKARALQEEMMTPMNIHRWRNLRGHDPERMDLIYRIQTLRKQILNQNVATLEKERALEETQRLYAALKEFMLKLPSHKIKAELNDVKATLSGKEKKMKALMAELNAKAEDEKTNNLKLEQLKSHLNTAKTQLIQEKKRKQKLLEERHILMQMQVQCFSAPPTVQRTLGAGFKIIGTF